MNNFTFQNATKIIFGKDTEQLVGKETALHSKKVLLHYGGGSIKQSGLYDTVVQSLQENGVEFVELGGVKPNPRVSLVREGVALCKEQNIDFILAVGGGSVIDSAKGIAAGAKYEGDVWDFYTGTPIETSLPIGVVLTIPAAGSESSAGSVITNEDGWLKRDALHDSLRPQFAILNPVLSYTLPAYQTACGITDMMSHILERYFTTEKNVDFTDRLCEGALKSIIHNAPIVLEQPTNYDARAEIMWAGTIAHNDLLGTGRTGDWASHNIEHEISGIYDIAHGAGLAIIFPAWMKYVYKHDVQRFAQFANRVWNVEIDLNDLERTALAGIKKTEEFFQSIGMPITLSEANIDDQYFREMARKATERWPIGNFVKLHEEDVYNIYVLAK
ncbi:MULTISPECIES: iron-containing alcohol dehydrogenase [Sutcliffiella]|uniref:NADH-dependent alcohol dehydrogenase n=1 Tax=Sutcliffiella cohnii TaxID=33932 RepID=A0A223KML5_9BACI|nr:MULTISPECIES: iron-containing alcohol dehydrogenase [Sutcliffiella]AST90745.1 NADH-dependent alcohol dehydrogenase [Sutcliffiella cohnii]WBL16531.1 iron-containing alcohol dehydrogenase [Sutcliffiella sp. NC1]